MVKKKKLLIFGSLVAAAVALAFQQGSSNYSLFTVLPKADLSATGQLRFRDKQSGAHYIYLQAPPSIAANFGYVLWAVDSSGVIASDGAGNLSLISKSTTANGQTCTLGSACDVNSGAATHSVAINEGAGAAMAGVSLGAHQTMIGAASANPSAKTVPDCQDSGGNHLNYTQSSDAFNCGTSGGGSGTVTSVGVAVPTGFTVSGSPVISSGTITIGLATGLTTHQVLGTGSSGTLALNSLTGADLPTPTTSTFGGIEDIAAVAHKWIDSIVSGVPHLSQPADADLSVSNVTTNNATSSQHGFLPTLSGNASDCLHGDGTYSGCSGGGGSGTSPFYFGPALTALDSVSNWSSVNLSCTGCGSTRINTNTAEQIVFRDSGSLNWRLRVENVPATPYTITGTLTCSLYTEGNSVVCGIYLYDGTKLEGIELLSQGGTMILRVEQMNSVTSDHATLCNSQYTGNIIGRTLPFRIKDDGTTRTFFYSEDDGNTFSSSWSTWVTPATCQETDASGWLTPTKIGYGGLSAIGGSSAVAEVVRLVSWKITSP